MHKLVRRMLIRVQLDSTVYILSSPDNLIPGSAGAKRQAGQGGSTAHAAPTIFPLFQKHHLIT
jgi:hypothetical protein